jgi:hypothetical protein
MQRITIVFAGVAGLVAGLCRWRRVNMYRQFTADTEQADLNQNAKN